MNLADKLQTIENEIHALKGVQPLNGGALSRHSLTAVWTGEIDKNAPISQYSTLAAFEATFERNDGIVKTPLVQFSYELDPGYTAFGDIDYRQSYAAIIAMGEDSVTYRIVLGHEWWAFDESVTTGTLKLTVHALSPVEGVMTVKRVYS